MLDDLKSTWTDTNQNINECKKIKSNKWETISLHKKYLKKINKKLDYEKTHNPEAYERHENQLKKIAND